MKNLITYLKTLWSRVADSQRNDVRHDRRLTVGSPSGLDAKWKQNPFMRFAVVLTLIFFIGVGNVWGAADESVTFSAQGYSNQQAISSYTGTNFSIAFDKGTNSNSPKYYTSGTAIRAYGGNTMTISSSTKTIAKIEITFGSSDGSNTITTDVGTYSNGTWTGSATSVTFTIGGTSGNRRLSGIAITYAAATTTVTPDPTSITFAANTLDGSGEALGSASLDVSVSNGYQKSGTYLYVDVVSDHEDDCLFSIDKYYSYNSTSLNDITVEYLAVSAGTWTGRVIAQGYNSSYAAVNCTIPLSVTISAPACANQVTLTKGAQTNGTFSLNKSNGSYDNCLSNFVLTVSSILPSAGYACTGVTATGGNSTVTGPDGSGNYTVTYTKGNTISSTVTANFAAKVATPTFSPAAGTYTGAQNVTISCETADATIYYTTNGSNPTTSSSVYSTPISVTQGSTIKAFATKAGMPNSDVATATYTIRYTVSWSVNGTSYSSPVVVTCGSTTSTPANPSVPDECTGSRFMGWTSNSSWASDSAPGDLFNGTSPTITGNITFYAVFADEN